MNKMRFSVVIDASRQTVWDTLWNDETLRQWAGYIDPGTYMVGELKQGATVHFISAENGYGVTSLVEAITPGEYVRFRHSADTQDMGRHSRDEQWTGGSEEYRLSESDGMTTLSLEFDAPEELEEEFNTSYPNALQCIKRCSEATSSRTE